MSGNNLLVYVPSMGEAILRQSIDGLELNFTPTVTYEIVFPANSIDSPEVTKTRTINFDVVLRYFKKVEGAVAEPEEGSDNGATGINFEETLVRAVLHRGKIALGSGRESLGASEPYMSLDEKSRQQIDVRIRKIEDVLARQEAIAREIERRRQMVNNQIDVSDPSVDIAPNLASLELQLEPSEAEEYEKRRAYITKRINGYTNKPEKPLTRTEILAQLGDEGERLIQPADEAMKRQIATLNNG